jgi:hypothetical protein
LSLLSSFGLSSLLLVTALGVVLGKSLSDSVRDRTLADAVRVAEVAGDVGVRPQLHPDDLERGFIPLDTDRVTALENTLGRRSHPTGSCASRLERRTLDRVSDNARLWAAGCERRWLTEALPATSAPRSPICHLRKSSATVTTVACSYVFAAASTPTTTSRPILGSPSER